jgi:hypothetical protein
MGLEALAPSYHFIRLSAVFPSNIRANTTNNHTIHVPPSNLSKLKKKKKKKKKKKTNRPTQEQQGSRLSWSTRIVDRGTLQATCLTKKWVDELFALLLWEVMDS